MVAKRRFSETGNLQRKRIVGRVATLRVKGAAPALLLAVLILAVGSCGSGGTSSSEEETPPAETGSEKSTPARTGERGAAIPADIVSVTLGLTSSGDSGVSGAAILTDTSNGIEVTLNVHDLPGQPGTEHPAHIHEGGTCAENRAGDEALVLYPLEPAITEQGGTGASTTMIPDTTVVQLFSGAPKYVDVHADTIGYEGPPGVSCADIYTMTGGD